MEVDSWSRAFQELRIGAFGIMPVPSNALRPSCRISWGGHRCRKRDGRQRREFRDLRSLAVLPDENAHRTPRENKRTRQARSSGFSRERRRSRDGEQRPSARRALAATRFPRRPPAPLATTVHAPAFRDRGARAPPRARPRRARRAWGRGGIREKSYSKPTGEPCTAVNSRAPAPRRGFPPGQPPIILRGSDRRTPRKPPRSASFTARGGLGVKNRASAAATPSWMMPDPTAGCSTCSLSSAAAKTAAPFEQKTRFTRHSGSRDGRCGK